MHSIAANQSASSTDASSPRTRRAHAILLKCAAALAILITPIVAIYVADRNIDALPQNTTEWRIRSAQVIEFDVADLNRLPASGWTEIALPHRLDAERNSARNVWYRLSFAGSKPNNALWSVYISRPNASYSVYVNGRFIGGTSMRRPIPIHVTPLIFKFSDALLRPGANEIYVRSVREEAGGDLPVVYAGPDEKLSPIFEKDRLWEVTLKQFAVVCMLAMSVVLGTLFKLRAQHSAFPYFALALFFWALHISIKLIPQSPFDAPYLWRNLADLVIALVPISTAFFMHRCLELRRPRLEKTLLAWGALGVVAMIADPLLFGHRLPWFYNFFWHPVVLLIGLYQIWEFGRAAAITAAIETTLFATTTWWIMVLAVRDHMMVDFDLLPARPEYLTFVTPWVVLVFGFVFLRRFVLAVENVERARDELEVRVKEKSEELERNLVRIKDMEREQALLAERQRIVRDMHDGVGGQLVQALSIASNRPELRTLEQPLRNCLDELRFIIDSIEPVEDDLASVLGMLRLRLSRRLHEAGITMRWQMGDIPPLGNFGAQRVLHVSRIIQEAITNVLKHSRATLITVIARAEKPDLDKANEGQHSVVIEVIDNGDGFTASSSGGRGLANMNQRARQLNAQLSVEPSARGTKVRLEIPLTDPNSFPLTTAQV